MHHAELIIGTLENAKSVLPVFDTEASPDLHIVSVNRLTIDEARDVMREAASLPVRDTFRTFVIACKEATLEAQNALLKTLEEPVATTRFYIVVPHEEVLIKTVRSRLLRRKDEQQPEKAISPDAQAFLDAPYAERLEEIAKRAKGKDHEWMEEVLYAIELRAERQKDADLVRAVLMVRNYFGSSGASKKMLLEHVALLV